MGNAVPSEDVDGGKRVPYLNSQQVRDGTEELLKQGNAITPTYTRCRTICKICCRRKSFNIIIVLYNGI